MVDDLNIIKIVFLNVSYTYVKLKLDTKISLLGYLVIEIDMKKIEREVQDHTGKRSAWGSKKEGFLVKALHRIGH